MTETDAATEATDRSATPPSTLSRDPISGPLGVGLILLVGLPCMFIAQRAFGLWEPWETGWAEMAREMREAGRWFHPTLGGQSTPRPLLPLWLIAAGQTLTGGAEWGMRLPMSLSLLAGASALFLWLRGIFGGMRALIAAGAALACPAVFLSGTTLAGGQAPFAGALMATVATLGAIMTRPDDRGLALPTALGVVLVVDVLTFGLWGLWLPLAILTSAALGQRAASPSPSPISPVDLAATALAALVIGGGAIAGFSAALAPADPLAQAAPTEGLAWLAALAPAALIASAALLARRSRALAPLMSTAGALALAAPLAAALALGALFDAGAPAEGVPLLAPTPQGSAALSSLLHFPTLTPGAMPSHVDFNFWINQIGFGAYPWTALLPLTLVYLLRKGERAEDLQTSDLQAEGGAQPEDTPAAHAQTDALGLIAHWFIASLVAALWLGSAHGLILFPSTAAIGVGAALALSDGAFWAQLRLRPFLPRTLGLCAILIVLFLSKDFDRYPRELLGPLLTDGKLELPEGLSFGRSVKIIQWPLIALIVAWLMDGLSWPARLQAAWSARRSTAQLRPGGDAQAGEIAQVDEIPAPVDGAAPVDGGDPAPGTGAAQRGRLKDGEGDALAGGGAGEGAGARGARRLAEIGGRPTAMAPATLALALVFVVLAGAVWVPSLSHHLSQRGLLETFEARAQPGEILETYQVSTHNASYYFSNVARISTLDDLKARFNQPGRAFIVMPRERVASLNTEIRRATNPRRNIHVIDDRSSRYVLASNMLREGEQERSAVALALLPVRPKPIHQITPKNDQGERQFPQFDQKIQLIGYEVYQEDEVDAWGNPSAEAIAGLEALKKAERLPTFKTGSKLVIRYYFKVLRRVTSSQKIFLHVDTPGNRVNGDHVPLNDQFPTHYWLPGDYIVDTQWLDIEPGSRDGVYTLYMGFFLGSKRMGVTPRQGHDGSDRVKLGQIEIRNF